MSMALCPLVLAGLLWDIMPSTVQAPDAGNIEILHKYGTEEQKEDYCAP